MYLSSFFVLILFLTTTVNLANAALSATTTNTIKGAKPILVKTGTTTEPSLNDIVSVIMPDDATILSPGGITTYTVAVTDKLADIKPYITYLDSDGDLGDSHHRLQGINGIANVTYTWKDKNNRIITDLLEAFAECLSPYTLTVSATNAQAISSYGDPLSKTYVGTTSETYTITVPIGSGGCMKYIQPASMHVHTGKDNYEIKFPDGYNSTVWDSGVISNNIQTGGGFKVNSGFPTTGFDKASFNLIGSDSDQSNYRCTKSHTETRIILSGSASPTVGENCTVTYDVISQSDFVSGGTPTINMEYSIDGITWAPIDSYTIPTPNKWATGPRQRLQYNTLFDFAGGYPAAIACGARSTLFGISDMTEAASYFYDRADFTNAPNLRGSGLGGYFARDVDSTFMGEWGDMFQYNNSPWHVAEIPGENPYYSYYWTAETYSTGDQYAIHRYGVVAALNLPIATYGIVLCRG